jgi:hypothetical protein
MGPNESDGSRLVDEQFVFQKRVSRKLAGSVSIGRHSACDSKENMCATGVCRLLILPLINNPLNERLGVLNLCYPKWHAEGVL